jgi:hypothetical protein
MNLRNSKGKTKYYKMRPSAIYSKAPMFSFSDRKGKGNKVSDLTVLTSFPMFAKYSGLPSVKSIYYERLVLKLKPRYQSTASQLDFVKAVKDSLGSS